MRPDLDLTDQQVFDKIVSHLRNQNSKATNFEGVCLYRTTDGKKCSIGCVIPDNLYQYYMEGKSIGQLYHEKYINSELEMFLRVHCDLLRDMQCVHDTKPVSQWEQNFRYVAAKYNLLLDGLSVDISKQDNPMIPDFQKNS